MPPKTLAKRVDELDEAFADALSRIQSLEKKLHKIRKGHSKEKIASKESEDKDATEKKNKSRKSTASKENEHTNTTVKKRKTQESTANKEIVVKSKKARRNQTPVAINKEVAAAAPPELNPTLAESTPDCGMQQVVVTDPCEEHRCYDVLGIPPSASLEVVKRSFKRRALKAHPDKEGGSQEAFLCLNKAYELLSDMDKRSVYDFELQQLKSKDGQSFKFAGDARDIQNTSEEHGNAEMLSDAFFNVPGQAWLALFKILTNRNLHVLIQYLQSTLIDDKKKQPTRNAADKRSKSKMGVPGLVCSGLKYRGQVVLAQNCRVRSFSTQLDEALEGRMGLESLRQTVRKLTGEGSTVDDAFRAAVAQLIEKDQNSCFNLSFSFEFRAGSKCRLTTPEVYGVDQFLEQRQTLLDLKEKSATEATMRKAHGNMIAETKQVRIRRDASKRNLLVKLLEEARAEMKRRGQELPAEVASASGIARKLPPKVVKQFKVIGPRRVGILARPDPSLQAISYMEPRAIFDVTMVHVSHGLKFFRLSDESGWLPQCSRKEPGRIVVEQADCAFDLAAILDAGDSGNDSDSSSSSSSSSS